ncbi:OmpA family protein [Chryseobacterium shigense]|uniref:OOP family OmpA-OmpF porin n=1 Tax=Chryseobacterium shigense TaxID=297244 RepID=A0A841N631_9FLAO|nr:OmpA family protein [Chryseobacterium shigense]MBB6371977.1 OOP family OmpA-OmpF porin [Chryseobacterium shigense]
MKLGLLLLATLPIAAYAQDSTTVNSSNEYPNTFSSGSANVQRFDNKARRFNDWAISVGGGAAFMVHSDLRSIYDKKVNWGYNAYVSIDKQITHTFGLSLIYQRGETKQKAMLDGAAGAAAGVATATTKFDQLALMGDINFSNLLRRVDNHSPYRWALHGYAGIGIQKFNTSLHDANEFRWSDSPKRVPLFIDQKFDIGSIYYQFGVGLKYKVSRLIDIEARTMYLVSGDDEFDGGGWAEANDYDPATPGSKYNMISDSRSDNALAVTLGVSFKLGNKLSHLAWHDPLQEAYYRTSVLENTATDLVVCEKGDADNDGVCDDWDRQLDTPAGARVDGAGVALDMDLDGVIDLYDKCVTVPGPVENNGCPTTPVAPVDQIGDINKDFEGIEFELNSDKIRPKSFDKLNHAADVIKGLNSNDKFLVIGATDARGSAEYNLKLSQRRADAVVKYLNSKGVSAGMLTAEGRGKTDLKYPECDPATKCTEDKNEANRRVYFQAK